MDTKDFQFSLRNKKCKMWQQYDIFKCDYKVGILFIVITFKINDWKKVKFSSKSEKSCLALRKSTRIVGKIALFNQKHLWWEPKIMKQL